MSILGVALGVAVFVAIRLASASAVRSFTETVDSLAGTANLQVSGQADGLDETRLASLARHPGVAEARPVIQAIAANPDRPGGSLLVAGLDLFADPRAAGAMKAARGASPAQLLRMALDPDAIAVSQTFAARAGWKLNQRIELSYGGRRESFRITLLLPPEGLVRAYGGDVAILDIAAAQEKLGRVGRLDRIDLVVSEGPAFERVAREARRLFPSAHVDRPAARGRQVEAMIASFRLNLLALALVALFVGALLIFNSISISVVQRRREIGIARSIGVSRGQVLALFLGEALISGVAGSLAGLAFGTVLARTALASVGETVNTLYAPVKASTVTLDFTTLAYGFALGVAAALLSGLFPAIEAACTPPGVSSRAGSMVQHRRRRIALVSVAALVTAAAAVLAAMVSLKAGNGILGFASAGLLLLASAFASPAITVLLSRIAARPAGFAAGVEGRLAVRWLVQSLEKTAVVIAALAAAVTMLIALNTMVGSFRRTVEVWMDQTVRADIFVEPASRITSGQPSALPGGVQNIISRLPGVLAWDVLRSNTTTVAGKTADIYAFDFETMNRHSQLVFLHGASRKIVPEVIRRGEILVSETFQSRFRRGEGDSITVATPRGPRKLRIGGVFYDYTSEAGLILIDRARYARLWDDNAVNTAAIYVRPGVDPERVRRDLIAAASTMRFDLAVLPNRALKDRALSIFDSTFAITNSLKAVAIAIAVLGVITTMATLILQRQREIGILRAIGASRAQMAKMTVVECGLIGVFGTIIGMLWGPAVALVLIRVINRLFFGWTIICHLEARWFVEAAAWVLAASLLAGLIPARMASRMQPAEAVRDES